MRTQPLLIAVGCAAALVAAAACGPQPADRPSPEGPPPISAKATTPEQAPPPPAASPVVDTAPPPASPVAAGSEETPMPVPHAENAPPPPAPDPLAEIEKANSVRQTLALQRGRLQADVDEARARVAELEKRLLAVRNPFLPRPQLPADEERIWTTLDGAQRAARVEAQLEQARRDVEKAEADLAALPSAP